jgi:CHASE1-domain containing sensor protein
MLDTDLYAILILLVSVLFTLAVAGRAYAQLYRENRSLRKQLDSL